jgi:hypothetical protein
VLALDARLGTLSVLQAEWEEVENRVEENMDTIFTNNIISKDIALPGVAARPRRSSH